MSKTLEEAIEAARQQAGNPHMECAKRILELELTNEKLVNDLKDEVNLHRALKRKKTLLEKELNALKGSEETPEDEDEFEPPVEEPQLPELELEAISESVIKELQSINGVGVKIATSLYDAGYKTLDDIKSSTIDDLRQLPGVTATKARTILRHCLGEKEEKPAEPETASEPALEPKPKITKKTKPKTKPSKAPDKDTQYILDIIAKHTKDLGFGPKEMVLEDLIDAGNSQEVALSMIDAVVDSDYAEYADDDKDNLSVVE